MKIPLSKRLDRSSETPMIGGMVLQNRADRWVIDEVKKLEQQNKKMLEALNKLINVADKAVPMNFMKELDGVVSHCKQVVNEVEGEKK